jgi:hypothetical protein
MSDTNFEELRRRLLEKRGGGQTNDNSNDGCCLVCKKEGADPDRLHPQCRAILTGHRLCNDLTNALEYFLDFRWSPHEYGKPHPAYWLPKPNFEGDEAEYMAVIEEAYEEIAEAADRLIKLSMGPNAGVEAYRVWYPSDPDEFDGIHACFDLVEEDDA